ncbi:hypothetical protein Ga0100231_006285 [Opitutaceae bacterium TAV4]|nr:hypothetical protein Ga0100231_006285 [Opitutaceae bacterium TAV4]
MATEADRRDRRRFLLVELQGHPLDFDLHGMSLYAKYRALGNGVPVYRWARVIGRHAAEPHRRKSSLCAGRMRPPISTRQTSARLRVAKGLETGGGDGV